LGYLLSLDGTGYFSSETIHCKNCLTKTDEKTGKATYYHSAITPVLVKPGEKHVLSLPPAFITPQDGDILSLIYFALLINHSVHNYGDNFSLTGYENLPNIFM
jgi:hypothetical protein